MRTKLSRLGATATLIFCLTATSVPQSEPRYKELPRFKQVNAKLYRGAQPKRGGLKTLSELGIRTVIDLRGAGDRARAEEQEALSLGLKYYNVPLSWFGRPKDEHVDRVLQIIKQLENQPVFVHCSHGVDRTGLVVAVYRILYEGWSSEQAKAEAKRHGLHWWKFGIKKSIREHYKRRLSSQSSLPRFLGLRSSVFRFSARNEFIWYLSLSTAKIEDRSSKT